MIMFFVSFLKDSVLAPRTSLSFLIPVGCDQFSEHKGVSYFRGGQLGKGGGVFGISGGRIMSLQIGEANSPVSKKNLQIEGGYYQFRASLGEPEPEFHGGVIRLKE